MQPPEGTPLNPYQPPAAAIDVGPVISDGLPRAEVMAFVGPRGDHYFDKWSRVPRGEFLAGWNWAAAFFNLLWLLYRRMYREFAAAVGFAALMGVGESLLSELLFDGGYERQIERVGNLVFWIIFGVIGNGLYLRRARLTLARARAQIPGDEAARLAHLQRVGGTSWLSVIIGIIVMIALAIAIASLPDDL